MALAQSVWNMLKCVYLCVLLVVIADFIVAIFFLLFHSLLVIAVVVVLFRIYMASCCMSYVFVRFSASIVVFFSFYSVISCVFLCFFTLLVFLNEINFCRSFTISKSLKLSHRTTTIEATTARFLLLFCFRILDGLFMMPSVIILSTNYYVKKGNNINCEFIDEIIGFWALSNVRCTHSAEWKFWNFRLVFMKQWISISRHYIKFDGFNLSFNDFLKVDGHLMKQSQSIFQVIFVVFLFSFYARNCLIERFNFMQFLFVCIFIIIVICFRTLSTWTR